MRDFITKARQVHGDRYDYSKVIYKNAATKVTIICPTHGQFEQRPNNHISHTQGCKLCDDDRKRKRARSMALSKDEFVSRSIHIYGCLYKYENTEYVSSDRPVEIECTIHGPFRVARAEKHLTGQSCPACRKDGSLGERIIADVLDSCHYVYQREFTFDNCKSPTTQRLLRFDFYIPSLRMLIEFDGEQHTKASPLFKNMPPEKYKLHDDIKTTFACESKLQLRRFTTKDLPGLRASMMILVGC